MDIMKNTMATDGQKRRRQAEEQLAGEVRELLARDEHEGLRWQGTAIDLMEALHVAYETGSLQDEQGICLSFTVIVRRACGVLHRRCPSNPYECACRAKRRKGLLMNTYLSRYLRLMDSHPQANILFRSIGTTTV